MSILKAKKDIFYVKKMSKYATKKAKYVNLRNIINPKYNEWAIQFCSHVYFLGKEFYHKLEKYI